MIFTNMKLSDLCVEISYGYTASATENNTGCKFLRITDIQGGYVDWDKVPFCEIESKDITKYQLIEGDIVIARTGNSTGENFIFQGKNNAVFASYLIRYRVNKEIANPYYIWLNLRSSNWWGFVSGAKSGSAQAGANAKVLGTFEIPIPDLQTQNKIADFFQHINNKIQLNTQINQTLEQIAQALFKSWFVDFDPVRAKVQALSDGLSLEQAELAAMQAISGKTAEELTALSQAHPDRYAELAKTAKAFPCEMVEVDGVEVPKGWDNQSVGDVINVVDYVANGSFATLKENVTLLTEPDYAIYVRTTDFNSGFSKELRYVDKSAYDFLAKSVLIGNEVIISNVGDVGTVFRSPSWLGMPMTLGSNAIALKNYDIPHYLYLYFSSHKGQHDISSIVTGSAQLKFNKTNFRSLKVLIPNNSLLTKFEKFVFPIFEKIDANMAENLKLAEIRDLLLPRLLSGKMIDA